MRRSLLPLLLCLSACTTWQPVAYPAPTDPTFLLKGNVRITDTTGTAHVGRDARGRKAYLILTRYDGSPDSVARAAVRSIESGTTDDRESFGLMGIALGVAAVIIIGLSNFGAGTPY